MIFIFSFSFLFDHPFFDSSLPMSRCLANYNSQQMMSGGGVFGRGDDHWQGVHVLGGAFWRSGRAPRADWSLLIPKNLRKGLIDAGATTRYSAFVPALHVLKKLLI